MKMLTLCTLAPCLLATSVMADVSYSGSANLQAGYDSNVAVNELDRASNSADSSLMYGAKLGAKWQPAKAYSFSINAGQQFTDYQHSDDFDLTLTTVSASAALSNHLGKWALNSYVADARLNKDGFLLYQQHGVSWGKMWDPKLYTRFSVDGIIKQFDTQSVRDANAARLGVSAFFFTDTANEMVNIGYAYQNERAEVSEFDFASHSAQAKWQYPVNLFARQLLWQAEYHFELRDYAGSGVTSSLPLNTSNAPQARLDQRHRVSLGLAYTLTDYFTVDIKANYADYHSNADNADYSESQAVVGMTLAFN